MSWQTSVRRPARRSQTSMCLEMATPAVGQDRACSILNLEPHAHSLRSPGGGITKSTFAQGEPVCCDRHCSQPVVGPFSLPSSATLRSSDLSSVVASNFFVSFK